MVVGAEEAEEEEEEEDEEERERERERERELRHMSDNETNFLLSLYNSIWRTGDFPPSWRLAVVLHILKP